MEASRLVGSRDRGDADKAAILHARARANAQVLTHTYYTPATVHMHRRGRVQQSPNGENGYTRGRPPRFQRTSLTCSPKSTASTVSRGTTVAAWEARGPELRVSAHADLSVPLVVGLCAHEGVPRACALGDSPTIRSGRLLVRPTSFSRGGHFRSRGRDPGGTCGSVGTPYLLRSSRARSNLARPRGVEPSGPALVECESR